MLEKDTVSTTAFVSKRRNALDDSPESKRSSRGKEPVSSITFLCLLWPSYPPITTKNKVAFRKTEKCILTKSDFDLRAEYLLGRISRVYLIPGPPKGISCAPRGDSGDCQEIQRKIWTGGVDIYALTLKEETVEEQKGETKGEDTENGLEGLEISCATMCSDFSGEYFRNSTK